MNWKYILIFTLIIGILSSASIAQNLLSLPESVVYDAPRERYIVSNWGNGNLVIIDSEGEQSYFLQNVQCYAGLTIVNDTLYVSCREYGVKGFSLATGENVLTVPIAGAGNINDITADSSGNLYVSYPTGNIIYKVKRHTGDFWPFVTSGLNTPNGLYYDEVNDRLLCVSYRLYSPIQIISLEDSTIIGQSAYTIHNLDGLTRDNSGNWYTSTWYYDAVYRFDSTLTNPPEVFSQHAGDPADIYYNPVLDEIAVPIFNLSTVDFVSVPAGVKSINDTDIPSGIRLLQAYPNPFNSQTSVSYSLPSRSDVSLDLLNAEGQVVRGIFAGELNPGFYTNNVTINDLVSGVYFLRLTAADEGALQKIIFLK